MKKILGLAIVAVIIIAIASAGTWAYFSDVENSNSNILGAGTLDLKLHGGDAPYTILASLTNKGPGDGCPTPSPLSAVPNASLTNTGTLDGTLVIGIGTVADTISPYTSGSEFLVGTPGNVALSPLALMVPFIDLTGNGLSADDYVLLPTGPFTNASGTYYHIATGYTVSTAPWAAFSSYSGKQWGYQTDDATLLTLAANSATTWNFCLAWQIPNPVISPAVTGAPLPTVTVTPTPTATATIGGDNRIQGSSLSFPVTFTLTQSHS